jgi:hypothetical protein
MCLEAASRRGGNAILSSVLPLVIKSNNAGDRFVIAPDRPDDWTATLDCSGLEARHTFYEIHVDSLPHFLTGLAQSWRGWEGDHGNSRRMSPRAEIHRAAGSVRAPRGT